jgi:hypothetical protein
LKISQEYLLIYGAARVDPPIELEVLLTTIGAHCKFISKVRDLRHERGPGAAPSPSFERSRHRGCSEA